MHFSTNCATPTFSEFLGQYSNLPIRLTEKAEERDNRAGM